MLLKHGTGTKEVQLCNVNVRHAKHIFTVQAALEVCKLMGLLVAKFTQKIIMPMNERLF